jgi:hypothetical protein
MRPNKRSHDASNFPSGTRTAGCMTAETVAARSVRKSERRTAVAFWSIGDLSNGLADSAPARLTINTS